MLTVTATKRRLRGTYFKVMLLCVACSMLLTTCVEDNCKECRIQTYENGVLVSSGDWVEYCDQELQEVQGQTSTVGNMTTRMVCR